MDHAPPDTPYCNPTLDWLPRLLIVPSRQLSIKYCNNKHYIHFACVYCRISAIPVVSFHFSENILHSTSNLNSKMEIVNHYLEGRIPGNENTHLPKRIICIIGAYSHEEERITALVPRRCCCCCCLISHL